MPIDQGGKYYYGQNRPPSGTSQYTSTWFMIQQMLNRANFATLVQVAAITSTSTIDQPGQMDVIPLVAMLDGANNTSKHGTVYGVAYGRLQAGARAVIMDPKVGDIGIAVFADRDISNVRNAKKAAPPASRRRNSMSDAMYLMTIHSPGEITSYIQATDQGAFIISDGSADKDKPMQVVVAKDYVQLQKKGEPTYHVTVDFKNGQIIVGQDIVVGDNPFPDPPP